MEKSSDRPLNRTQQNPAPLAVGVTGHRVLTDLDAIVAGIDESIERIRLSYGERTITLLSSLAEGADQLVAKRLIEKHLARLVVPLPMPEEDYLTTFLSDEGRACFRDLLTEAGEIVTFPDCGSWEEAFEQAGFYIADRCDVMLAIWDGQNALGRAGTADIVARVRSVGKPLVIVRAGNRRPGTMEPTSLGEGQGRVISSGL